MVEMVVQALLGSEFYGLTVFENCMDMIGKTLGFDLRGPVELFLNGIG